MGGSIISELNIGDVVYYIDNDSSKIYSTYKVIKVTRTLATLENEMRFKRQFETGKHLSTYPTSFDLSKSFQIETDELKDRFQKQKLKARIIGHCKKIIRDIDNIQDIDDLEIIKKGLYHMVSFYFESKGDKDERF